MKLSLFGATCALVAPVCAQSPYSTPGQPNRGQVDVYDNTLSPAIAAAFDLSAGFLDGGPEDGFDFQIRAFELQAQGWVDPNTNAYAVILGDGEEFELEEAAVRYLGLSDSSTLRAGKFFVDFGKQMQAHVHDLATPDRPLALRTYLGEELPGIGLQYGDWFATGDESAVRYSVGLFDTLGEAEEEEGADVNPLEAERVDVEDLSWTARITGFQDVGDRGVFQWGLSGRGTTFGVESAAAVRDDLGNTVFGVDLTLGWTDDQAERGWTFGTEILAIDGDLSTSLAGGGATIDVQDDTGLGYYFWVDRALSTRDSAGLLYSSVELPEQGLPTADEITLYWSRYLTEQSRVRLALVRTDVDGGDDLTTALVQFTNFIGPHSHGVDW